MFVSLLVLSEMVYMIIDLATLVTRLCHVGFLVLSELVPVTKGLPTFLASVGLLPCVNSLMLHKA